ncbi:MAG: M36 family metallopeptidase [Acidobacteria bacterium]|nr:M36 family metallopeptidase [Acidobacteriota bacterium]MBI3426639.1 M36 family metallopeptidase [Acidobacteriota bacterium]
MLKRIAVSLLFVCAAALLCSLTATLAQRGDAPTQVGNQPPALPDFDIRAGLDRSQPDAGNERARRFRQAHPDAELNFSSLTGAPSRLWSRREPLLAASSADAAVNARRFLKDNAELFQLSAAESEALTVTRRYRDDHNGATHLTLAQTANGREVFQSEFTTHFDRTGALLAASGELIPALPRKLNRTQPALTAEAAVQQAASLLGAAQSAPSLATAGSQPAVQTPAIARAEDTKLIYFPLTAAEVRLAWQTTLWLRDTPDVYLILLDAERGSLLYRQNLTWYEQSQTNPHGQVFTKDSPRPDAPAHNPNPPTVPREDLPFSPAPFNGKAIFGANDPHLDWWAGAAATSLISNNTDTHLDRDANNAADLPRLTADNGNFAFPLDLTQAPTTADNQRVAQVNLFYWVNRYHDILYSYGFTEAAGNFQTNNFTFGGRAADAVQADAQDGGGTNNANFSTGADGSAARVQMYLWSGSPQLDGSLDQGVILHELSHGLSIRLVGNGTGLTGIHAGGMGEGWSDYFGIALLRSESDDVDGSYPVGQYAFNNYRLGIRRFPYSTDKRVFPLTFGDIRRSTEVHNVGEIWCNALLEMRALLIKQLGFQEGQRQSLQLVVDGLKLTPRAPTFLDARNAILLADKMNNNGTNQCLLWQAFSKRGMGAAATTLNGNDGRPEEAFDLPASCSAAGTLSLNRSAYLLGETIQLKLGDRNASTPARVRVESTVTGDQETLTLNADATLVGAFDATLRLAAGAANRGDGVLQASLAARDKIKVTYDDADNGNGTAAQVIALADLAGEKTVFEDTVESANPGWQTSGTPAVWSVTASRAGSGVQCWTDSASGNYANNTDSSLISPVFDFSNAAGVTLTFAHSYALETGFDYGLVEFSLDDGATWQRAAAFTGTQAAFTQARLSLDKLAGIARARLRFHLLTDAGTTADGWYVDDIRLIIRTSDPAVLPPTATLAPVITEVLPAFGSPNGGTAVKLNGANFTESADTRVFFDNAAASNVSVLGGTVLSCTTPPHIFGPATIRVENRNGAAVFTNGFTYYTRPATVPQPKATSIFPASGSLRGGTTVTLTGTDFTPEAAVMFGTLAARSVTFVSANVLRAGTPTATATGPVDVAVTNPTTAKATLANAFNYTAATPPTARTILPNGGERFFIGNTITLRWQSSDNRTVVRHRLELQRSLGQLTPAFEKVSDIATDLPGTAQSFNWTIPNTLAPSTLYRLRVIAVDDEGSEGDAYSSADFSVERRWLANTALPQAAQRSAVTNDGRYIYSIGGRTSAVSSSTTSTVRRYDPDANAWTTLASLPIGVNAADAAYLNGKIYVPGGINVQTELEPRQFVYDIAANTWDTAATPPGDVYLYATVADTARGVYYQLGGVSLSANEAVNAVRAYDPRTNTWSSLPPLLAARFAHEAALINGKLYVAGGSDTADTLTSAEVFDFSTQSWTPIAPLPRARRYAVNGFGTDEAGRPLWLLAAGEEAAGLPAYGNVEAYDLAANRWFTLDNSFNLTTARTALSGTLLNGFLYALGGGTASSGTTTNSTANERLKLTGVALTVPNQPPLLTVPATQLAFVNAELRLPVTANDFGADSPLTLTAQGLPAGATFDVTSNGNNQARGLLRWTPQAADAGRIVSISFTVSDGQLSDVKTVALRVVSPGPLATVSAADYRGGQLALDSIVAAFGTNLASGIETAQSLPLPQALAGTTVTVNGVLAPLFFVSPTQLNFLIPPNLELGPAQILVSTAAGSYALGTVEIVAARPALFTANASGQGDAAAVATPDGVTFQTAPFDVTLNGKPNVLLLFGSGLRRASTNTPNASNGVADAVNVTIEGLTARVLFAGAQGGLAGLDQLNVELPAGLAGKGARRVDVLVTVNGLAANRVTIAIK